MQEKIWKKPYSVRSLLIVGLEPAINTEEAVHMLCQEGIMPILSVFRPLPNSQMSEFLPPTNEILYNLYTGFIQYSSCKLKEIFKGNQRRFADCVFLSVSRF